ncbi:MAG: hypothetical protein WKG07_47680 [Hymenobacter sp.]
MLDMPKLLTPSEIMRLPGSSAAPVSKATKHPAPTPGAPSAAQ